MLGRLSFLFSFLHPAAAAFQKSSRQSSIISRANTSYHLGGNFPKTTNILVAQLVIGKLKIAIIPSFNSCAPLEYLVKGTIFGLCNLQLSLMQAYLLLIWKSFAPLNSNCNCSVVTTTFVFLVFTFLLSVVLQGTRGSTDCVMSGSRR